MKCKKAKAYLDSLAIPCSFAEPPFDLTATLFDRFYRIVLFPTDKRSWVTVESKALVTVKKPSLLLARPAIAPASSSEKIHLSEITKSEHLPVLLVFSETDHLQIVSDAFSNTLHGAPDLVAMTERECFSELKYLCSQK